MSTVARASKSNPQQFGIAIIGALFVMAGACSAEVSGHELPKAKPAPVPSSAPREPSPIPPASQPLPVEPQAASATTEDLSHFESFWQVFRSAVERDDRKKLADLTKFPLEVRGESDDDPVRHFKRPTFLKKLDALLASDPGLSMDRRETQKEHVLRTNKLNDRQYSGDTNARVGNFEFEQVKGRWWMTCVYLSSEEG